MTAMPEGKIVCIGGDGGELNSVTLENPILLVFSLLDQLTALGESAKQLGTVLRSSHPQHKELLSNILKIDVKGNDTRITKYSKITE